MPSFDRSGKILSPPPPSAIHTDLWSQFGSLICGPPLLGHRARPQPRQHQQREDGQLAQKPPYNAWIQDGRVVDAGQDLPGGSLVAIREWTAAGGYAAKFQHTDALGSPVAVTNQAGTLLERNEYEPYGAVINKPNYQGIGYTGHVQDAVTGLTYMQQRYYDPQVGLFLSVDPVTAFSNPVGTFNRFRYANNNPYRFIDPDGRAVCPKEERGCVDSPRTESGTTPQLGPSSEQRAVDSQVKAASDSGRLSDGTKLDFSGREQGFKASADGTSSNPMQTGCAKCSDGSRRETGSYNKGALGPNESGGHTHTNRTSGLPGPEDGRLANATDKSAYVISERGAFSVEKTEVGYRIRTIDGAAPSSTERAKMRLIIDGWNQNQGGSGISCSAIQC
ncbi:RHS repeat-associated core domain-containing protein [Pseudoxanthomonas sp. SL93]|uniref:RHS repeat-associated core domain-containing protein n=1 Tax=Pseudoxanthomonas sp. SL93 TaxID=2995142 RepID=UPI00226E7E16|nr:RHS repeat-associated core domain-containing protein [Pseudoxanthomonas sp. SL93]WAC64025.1 RHS repeat-associated core domain-containing protein [Pseudoxanthomonas sp. SL93]